MPKYGNLIDQGSLEFESAKPKKSKQQKIPTNRGCQGCPLNTEGCIKVIGLSRVIGRKIFLWAQSPGYKELNYTYVGEDGVKRRGMELVGPSGDMVWRELEAVGISREDCDIQNVLRCRPAAWDPERQRHFDRKPTKEELHHCSIYTEKAIDKNQGKAKVHIVFGLVAAAALLGKEYKKGHTIFWSERFQAKVICIAHPAYFLREGFAQSKLQEFRAGLRAAADIVKGSSSRYAYVESMDIKAITTVNQFTELAEQIKNISAKERIAHDIEDAPAENEAGRKVLCIGYSYAQKMGRVVYLDKSDVKIESRSRFLEIFEKLHTDPKIRFIAHHGLHDTRETKRILGFKTANFDYDTEYAEYMAYSDRKGGFSLAAIAEARFPQYAGYKEMVKEFIDTSKGFNPVLDFDRIPHTVMTPYNATDDALTKEIEMTTRKKINLPLLHVYMEAALIFDEMNRTGPLLDEKHYERVMEVLPDKIKRLKQQLAVMAGDPDFNPGSPIDVPELLYVTLGLEKVVVKKKGVMKVSTDKNALKYLSQFHEAPALIDQYRKLSKMRSTYLVTYKHSAELFDGEIHTIWHVTGTGTGRRRSGKEKDQKKRNEGITNLQNIHGDEMLQNLLVSDVNWRKILKYDRD